MSQEKIGGVAEYILGMEKKRPKKVKRPTIPKQLKNDVWNKYVGKNKLKGKCYVCNDPVHYQGFEVGHNRAVSKGGSNHINNLRPICIGCNRSMGTMSIEVYKRKHYSKPTKKKRRITKRKKKREKEGIPPVADLILK